VLISLALGGVGALFISVAISCSHSSPHGSQDSGADQTAPDAPSGDGPAAANCSAAAGQFDGGTFSDAFVAVPIHATATPSSGFRLSILLTVNGVPVEALLDTGSSGLRVFASAVADAGLPESGAAASQKYNSGETYYGYLATANIGLAGQQMQDAAIQVVTAECEPTDASADACVPNPSFFSFPAIVGVGLRESSSPPVRSPFASLAGLPSFTIHLNGSFGTSSDDAGVLTLGISQQEYESFFQFQLPVELTSAPDYFRDYAVQSCVMDETTGTPWCEWTLFDTGDPNPYVETLDAGPDTLPDGTPMTVAIFALDGGCAFSSYGYSATVSNENEFEVRRLTGGVVYNNLSMHAFYQYDVLYDQALGRIGLRLRAQ
jgi:Aspartyl protease/Protein of unknown function (DUF3443)